MIAPKKAIVRVTSECLTRLEAALTRRYPDEEWATLFTFGWRVAGDTLVITLVSLVLPEPGEMDETVGHVRIFEPYSLRAVLESERTKLGLGVVHSHPENCAPLPSYIDDDMDEYYRKYFGEFLGKRPYASLIVSRSSSGKRSLSGRLWLGQESFVVERVCVAGAEVQPEAYGAARKPPPAALLERTARAVSLYGEEALGRLWRATVAVVGVGGTGSAAAHVLARAGVGRLVLIDSDRLDPTNIERVHGSYASHARDKPQKVEIVRALCLQANPDMEVVAIEGNCLQPLAIDWLVLKEA